MPWIKRVPEPQTEHSCSKPELYRKSLVLLSDKWVPTARVGDIWQCPTCKDRYVVNKDFIGLHFVPEGDL